MRGGCKLWPARLLATVAALALLFTCTFGAYAHAAGHHHHAAGHGPHGTAAHGAATEKAPGHVHSAHGHVGHTHVGHTHVGHGQAGHDGGDADTSNTDGCCALCHCAHVILAAAPVIPHPVFAAPPIQPEVALYGAVAGGLERPPKPSLSA